MGKLPGKGALTLLTYSIHLAYSMAPYALPLLAARLTQKKSSNCALWSSELPSVGPVSLDQKRGSKPYSPQVEKMYLATHVGLEKSKLFIIAGGGL